MRTIGKLTADDLADDIDRRRVGRIGIGEVASRDLWSAQRGEEVRRDGADVAGWELPIRRPRVIDAPETRADARKGTGMHDAAATDWPRRPTRRVQRAEVCSPFRASADDTLRRTAVSVSTIVARTLSIAVSTACVQDPFVGGLRSLDGSVDDPLYGQDRDDGQYSRFANYA